MQAGALGGEALLGRLGDSQDGGRGLRGHKGHRATLKLEANLKGEWALG